MTLSVQLFIKLLVRYLEHLDFLGLRHVNRLKSWVGCKLIALQGPESIFFLSHGVLNQLTELLRIQ